MRTYVNVLKKVFAVVFHHKFEMTAAIVELFVAISLLAMAIQKDSVTVIVVIDYLFAEIFLLRSKSVTPAIIFFRFVVALFALKGFRILEHSANIKAFLRQHISQGKNTQVYDPTWQNLFAWMEVSEECKKYLKGIEKVSTWQIVKNIIMKKQVVGDAMFCNLFFLLMDLFGLTEGGVSTLSEVDTKRYDFAFNLCHLLEVFGRGKSLFPQGEKPGVIKAYQVCNHLRQFINDKLILQAIANYADQGDLQVLKSLQEEYEVNTTLDPVTGKSKYNPDKLFFPDQSEKINNFKTLYQLVVTAIKAEIVWRLRVIIEEKNNNALEGFIKNTNKLFKADSTLQYMHINGPFVDVKKGEKSVSFSGFSDVHGIGFGIINWRVK